MKWDMEIEEIEAILEKIWDLHDKLSDAIHSISRTHFLNSIKSLKKSAPVEPPLPFDGDAGNTQPGFVFVKGFRATVDEEFFETRSLTAIRTALENLEDQLEFFHTVQIQQRAERDVAVARLEQSRMILALMLAEHHGKNYKVIDEALAFVGDVRDAGHFVSPENPYSSANQLTGSLAHKEGKGSNFLTRLLISSFYFVRSSIKMDHMGWILSNAALIGAGMLSLLCVQQVGLVLEHRLQWDDCTCSSKTRKKSRQQKGSSSSDHLSRLDVLLARG